MWTGERLLMLMFEWKPISKNHLRVMVMVSWLVTIFAACFQSTVHRFLICTLGSLIVYFFKYILVPSQFIPYGGNFSLLNSDFSSFFDFSIIPVSTLAGHTVEAVFWLMLIFALSVLTCFLEFYSIWKLLGRIGVLFFLFF